MDWCVLRQKKLCIPYVPTGRYAYERLMIEVVLSLVTYSVVQRRCVVGEAWRKVTTIGSIAPDPHKGCVQRHPTNPPALGELRTKRVTYTGFMLVLV